MCELLGSALSSLQVKIVSGAGKPGIRVSQSFYEKSSLENLFEPEFVQFCFRRKKSAADRLVPNIGLSVHYDASVNELRRIMLAKAKAMIIIGGEMGTIQEELIASENKILVIPMASTKGAAEAIWEKYKSNLCTQFIGATVF